jgi:hypothetical protein
MPYSRGQIVEVSFRLPPDGEGKFHPVVILSNEEINTDESGFTAVMMTTNSPDDEYSFEITSKMVAPEYNDDVRHREVRMHLIGYFLDKDVQKNSQPRRILREEHLKRLVTQINEITFGFSIDLK